ncbi:MAG: glutathione S-transferase family protein [Xanthobacteraceae bacterium]|nr:glutathione S-transferase family protein [Xanthobacteraceae bacterium]
MTSVRLFDLAGEDPQRRFSPACWKTRLALAHKAVPVETTAWRFTEKEAIAKSGRGTVPVIVNRDRWISDSWSIAEYLEDTFPDAPSLFGGEVGQALARFLNHWADMVLVPSIFGLIAMDIHDHLAPQDLTYFRSSREQRIGMTLEALVASRDDRVAAIRASMQPLRQTLKSQQFLGGDSPRYADYAVFGPFQWARCVSPFQILERDDPVFAWRNRILDLFGGLARNVPSYD